MKHRPRKCFGQNFLHHLGVIEEICRAIRPQFSDRMVEIGPGLGALTKPLLSRLEHLTAIEIDTDLVHYWSELMSGSKQLSLIQADALSVDYSSLGSSLRVVGNLPYNISTPLLIHLLQHRQAIDDMHFMLQKEVVERICAVPGNKTYGRLSVLMQAYFEVEHLFNVPPEAFDPKPKVDSAFIRLVPRKGALQPDGLFSQLEYVVAHAFAMRRKTLANNLKSICRPTDIADLGINPGLRPEQLLVSDYLQLTQYIFQQGAKNV